MFDDLPPCEPGACTFRHSDDTNEPIGRCLRCEATVEQAEQRAEQQAEPTHFADVPDSEREAYLGALDRESVREGR